MRALPSPGLEAKGSSWMPLEGRDVGDGEAVTGESGCLPGEKKGDSPDSWEGDGDTGAVGSCILLSFSPVEKETVFLRFLRGGTRTIGDEGRGYGGDGGRLLGAVFVSGLLSLVSPERTNMSFERPIQTLAFQMLLLLHYTF